MALLPSQSGYNSLVDVMKSLDPQGNVAVLAELLNTSSDLVKYATVKEGNLPTGHKSVVRAGLPTVSPRRFYQGVAPTKSERATVEDTCAMIEMRPSVDKKLADLNGNTAKFRYSESIAHIEAMTQYYQKALIYGNANTAKDEILGLSARYASLSAGVQKANVINGGGAAAVNTSIWLVVWGEEAVSTFYPKGGKGGLQQQDLGEQRVLDGNNNPFQAYEEILSWDFGLSVPDWRYAVRIANVDTTDLVGQSGTQAITAGTWINKLMIKALARIPSMGMGVATFLANRTVKEMLSVGALDKSQNALSFSAAVDQYGRVTAGSVAGNGTGISGGQLLFQGVPVLTVDQILSTEATIS